MTSNELKFKGEFYGFTPAQVILDDLRNHWTTKWFNAKLCSKQSLAAIRVGKFIDEVCPEKFANK